MADIINKKISLLPQVPSLNNGINYLAVTMATGAAKKNVRIPLSLIRQNILGWNDNYESDAEKSKHANVLAYTDWLCTILSNEIKSYADGRIDGVILSQINTINNTLPRLSANACISAMKEAYLSVYDVSSYTIDYINNVSLLLSDEIRLEHSNITSTLDGRITTNSSNITSLGTNLNTYKNTVASTYATKTLLNEHITKFNSLTAEYEDLSGKVAITSADVATNDHAGRVKLGYTSDPDNGYYAVEKTGDGDIYVHVTNAGGGGSSIPTAEWNNVKNYVDVLKPKLGESGELYDILSTRVYTINIESLSTRLNTYSDFNVCRSLYDLVYIDKSFDYYATYRCYVATDEDAPPEYGDGAKMLISANVVEARTVDLEAGTYVKLNSEPLETGLISELAEYTVIREFMINEAYSESNESDESNELVAMYIPSKLYVVNSELIAIDKTDDYKEASMVIPYDNSFEKVVTYIIPEYSVLNRLIELRQDLLYMLNDIDDIVEMSAVNKISNDISLTADLELTVDIDVSLTSETEHYIAISIPKILTSTNDIEIKSIQLLNDVAHIVVKNTSSDDIDDASLTATVVYADMEV